MPTRAFAASRAAASTTTQGNHVNPDRPVGACRDVPSPPDSEAPAIGDSSHPEVVGSPHGHLRPFFGFYGGKWRDSLKHYPAPELDTIVEPFAGSAGYSVRYANRRVILCELDPVIAGVWRYLIAVKPSEILAIPDLDPDGSVDDLKVCDEAKWLVGMWLNRGVARPRKRPSKWMRDHIRPGSFWGDRVRGTIASQVESIRHWQIVEASYEDCPDVGTATWFIDPPYELAGRHYRFGANGIDYQALAAWCRSRPGQTIVCENDGAAWLPFEPLAEVKTTRSAHRSVEVVWVGGQGSADEP